MSAAASISAMVKKIAGLAHTQDVSERESQFIDSVVGKTDGGKNTTALTAKQVETIERIHSNHFA